MNGLPIVLPRRELAFGVFLAKWSQMTLPLLEQVFDEVVVVGFVAEDKRPQAGPFGTCGAQLHRQLTPASGKIRWVDLPL